jgi:hypothetical protein
MLEKGKLATGANLVNVKVDEAAVFEVTFAVANELPLHGHGPRVHLQPRVMVTLSFGPTRAGRYPYEFHRSDLEPCALEAYARGLSRQRAQ